MKQHDDERGTFSLALTVAATVFAVAGIVLLRAGGGVGIIGIVFLVFGLGGILEAILVRIGLMPMPGAKRKREDPE